MDGIRLGCAICIEVQFAEVFDEYRRLGVDGVLLSAYPPDDDPMFQITARAHASVNNLWISFAVPANIGGRLAGFPIGTPMDTTFAYGTNRSQLRDRYYEAHDLIMRAWTEKDTFAFNGRLNQQRYVNVWPRPVEEPSADLDSRRRLGGDVARL